MLKSLTLQHVGPSDAMEIGLSQRMNLLTGDNGLGKTFLLDVAWWALTRTWVSSPAVPHRREHIQPRISFVFEGKGKQELRYQAGYDWKAQAWGCVGVLLWTGCELEMNFEVNRDPCPSCGRTF